MEAQAHHAGRQTDNLEQLAAAIAGNGRDAHLGHDLEQALADRLAIAATQLSALAVVEFDAAFAHDVEQCLIRHVRIDAGSAITDEAGKVMRITRRAGLDDQIAAAAQTHLDQMVMNCTCGKQRMNRYLFFDQIAIRDQQHQIAIAHCSLSLMAQATQCVLKTLFGHVLQVDERVLDALIGHADDLAQLALREDRRVQHDLLGVMRARMKHVELGTDLRLQRHHDRLAQ